MHKAKISWVKKQWLIVLNQFLLHASYYALLYYFVKEFWDKSNDFQFSVWQGLEMIWIHLYYHIVKHFRQELNWFSSKDLNLMKVGNG